MGSSSSSSSSSSSNSGRNSSDRLCKLLLGLIFLCCCRPTVSMAATYTAVGRFGHSAVLVNDSIIFYGGDTSITSSTSTPLWISDMAILPVNVPYSLTDPPWRSSSGPQSSVGGPVVYSHTAFVGGGHGDSMILVGGVMPATEKSSSDDAITAYSYATSTGRWNSFTLPSGNYLNREGAASSVTSNGDAYIWGGKRASVNKTGLTNGGTRTRLPPNMYRVDTLNPVNSTIAPDTSPMPNLRYAHTQTLINNRTIVVLGGFEGHTGEAVSLADIWLYDIYDNQWSHVNAKLDKDSKPANRSSHSQLLMPDGKSILIYGGYDGYHVFNDVAVLDTQTWTWTIKNTNAAVQGRADHTATLVGTNMIVAFGFTGVSTALTVMSDIEVLDITTWSWTSIYTPSAGYISGSTIENGSGTENRGTTTAPNMPSLAIVAGSITGVVVVLVLIIVALYMFNYQRQKQRRENSSPIPAHTHMYTQQPSPPTRGQTHRDDRRLLVGSDDDATLMKQTMRQTDPSLTRAPTRLRVVPLHLYDQYEHEHPLPSSSLISPYILSPPPARQSYPPAHSEVLLRRAATTPVRYYRNDDYDDPISKPDEQQYIVPSPPLPSPSSVAAVRRAATTPRAASSSNSQQQRQRYDTMDEDGSIFDQQEFILRNDEDSHVIAKEDIDEEKTVIHDGQAVDVAESTRHSNNSNHNNHSSSSDPIQYDSNKQGGHRSSWGEYAQSY